MSNPTTSESDADIDRMIEQLDKLLAERRQRKAEELKAQQAPIPEPIERTD